MAPSSAGEAVLMANIGFTFDLNGRFGTLIAVDAVLGLLFFVPLIFALVGFTTIDWADRMARLVHVGLTAELRRRLNRFWRIRTVIRIFLVFILTQVILLTTLGTSIKAANAGALLFLPAGIWAATIPATLLPRWKSTGVTHVAHLRRLSVRDTISKPELVAIVATYPIAAGLAGWSLWAAGEPWKSWFWLPGALLVFQMLVTLGICRYVMAARAAGGDALELAWDDVLRFHRVRSLVATSSFTTLYFIAASAGDLARVRTPTYVTGIACAFLVVAFSRYWQRSRAWNNWRRAWAMPGASHSTSSG